MNLTTCRSRHTVRVMIRKRRRQRRQQRQVTTLAAFLKKRRGEAALTQQALSDLSGVGMRTLAAIEGGSDPKASTLVLLANALDASTDEMLGRTA